MSPSLELRSAACSLLSARALGCDFRSSFVLIEADQHLRRTTQARTSCECACRPIRRPVSPAAHLSTVFISSLVLCACGSSQIWFVRFFKPRPTSSSVFAIATLSAWIASAPSPSLPQQLSNAWPLNFDVSLETALPVRRDRARSAGEVRPRNPKKTVGDPLNHLTSFALIR